MSDYGTVDGVAAIATTWTRDGAFYDADLLADPQVIATNPPLSTVSAWLDDVSANINSALLQAYITAPVNGDDSPSMYSVLSDMANSFVADMVAERNNSGRFFSDAFKKQGVSGWVTIQGEIQAFTASHIDALLNDGATRITRLVIVEDE